MVAARRCSEFRAKLVEQLGHEGPLLAAGRYATQSGYLMSRILHRVERQNGVPPSAMDRSMA